MNIYDKIQHRFYKNISGFIYNTYRNGLSIKIYVKDKSEPGQTGKIVNLSMIDFRLSYKLVIPNTSKTILEKPSWL